MSKTATATFLCAALAASGASAHNTGGKYYDGPDTPTMGDDHAHKHVFTEMTNIESLDGLSMKIQNEGGAPFGNSIRFLDFSDADLGLDGVEFVGMHRLNVDRVNLMLDFAELRGEEDLGSLLGDNLGWGQAENDNSNRLKNHDGSLYEYSGLKDCFMQPLVFIMNNQRSVTICQTKPDEDISLTVGMECKLTNTNGYRNWCETYLIDYEPAPGTE